MFKWLVIILVLVMADWIFFNGEYLAQPGAELVEAGADWLAGLLT